MYTFSSTNPSIELNKDNRDFYLTCTECKSLCSLELNYEVPAKVSLLCSCGCKKSLLLTEYLSMMKNSPKTVDNLCIKHGYKSYIAFCTECNQHLCQVCMKGDTHKNHNTIGLSTNKRAIDISAITKISKSISEKYKKLIKLLEDKIKKVKDAYNKYYDNQTAMTTFVKELEYTYNKCSNYYCNENINQIGDLNSNITLPNNFDSINDDVINN